MRMQRYEDKERDLKRSVITFDSFDDLLTHNREGTDHRSKHMDDPSFYGVNNMQEADQLGQKGLPKAGIEAINLAEHKVALMAGDLYRPAYDEYHDTAGAFVDMGRYMQGEPECMVDFTPTEEPGQNKIVALILNITYNWAISAKAIKENGQAMFALVEAIETAGMQAEIWVDMYVRGFGSNYRARTAVRLKKAGEPFDVSMFMYALTHNSFLRAHLFNAMHSHDKDVREACGIHPSGGYGSCINNAADMEDFPPYSIYIPCISHDSQAGKFVPAVLRQLGLMK
ncbi:hypothetical protein J4T96_gp118 [Mycobacterium phage Finemlucis]|uniref:DUF7192 domain-containing protein n=1 Tax=Mycobacterium phage Finemlucis TaxID=2015844 RepID=A0A291IA20_9CAUD|nr:hypothetical protein J4T96_gp118 [Mycobacterium phage Finemlucis]ATG86530.1 hypothetical protein SEA_FINEMLUCIS_129 [Mycobacterium phage Finemlucis]